MSYSNDIRARAVHYFLQHSLRYKDVANIFGVGVATLHEWVQRHKKFGKVVIGKSTGRPRVLPRESHDLFKQMLLNNADKTLEKLSEQWHEISGQKLSIFCVSRTIRRIGFTLKKRRFVLQNVRGLHTKKSENNTYPN